MDLVGAYWDVGRIGDVAVQEALGADSGGLDASFGVNAASEVLTRGVNMYEKNEADKTSAANATAAANKAVAADQQLASALTLLIEVTANHDVAKMPSAQIMVQQAKDADVAAGANLPPNAAAKRLSEAKKALAAASQAAFAAPSDKGKQAAMQAWQIVVQGAAMMQPGMPGAGGGKHEDSGPSFLVRMHAGVPTWGWIVGGGVVGTGLILIIRSLLKRKK